MKFCEILRMLIDERNMTQKKLACDLQMPASTLGGYVQGTSEPDFETLKLIADYFETSTDYLLGYKVSKACMSLEHEVLNVFRMLSPSEQKVYLDQGRAFLKNHSGKNQKTY